MATSYSNPGGSGYRPFITSSCDMTQAGTWPWPSALTNGSTSDNLYYWSGTQAVADNYLKFDFGQAVVIDEADWYQDTTGANGTWKWQGSNNDSDWTDIGTSFSWGGSANQTLTELNGNSTAYRYYRLLGVSGDSSQHWMREMKFKIDTVTAGNNYLISSFSTGDRTGIITASTDMDLETGSISNLLDGAGTPAVTDNDLYWLANIDVSGKYIKFDFGSGNSPIITQAIWVQSGGTSYDHGTWKWQTSDNDSTWSDVDDSFTLGDTKETFIDISANTSGHRYYRMLGVSGVTTQCWLYQILFRINTSWDLSVANASHALTSGSPTLIMNTILSINSSSHAVTSEIPTLDYFGARKARMVIVIT